MTGERQKKKKKEGRDLEGELAGEGEGHEDHAGDPEEEDIEAGLEDRRRVEGAQVLGVVGPAEDGEREKARGEPRVQHVRVLFQPQLRPLHAVLAFRLRQCLLQVLRDHPATSCLSIHSASHTHTHTHTQARMHACMQTDSSRERTSHRLCSGRAAGGPQRGRGRRARGGPTRAGG